jgi:hypothetical protein
VLTLITGNPGNAKTLHTIWLVERDRKRAAEAKDSNGALLYPGGRTVYYIGIEILDPVALPWVPCPMQPSGYSDREIDKGRPATAPDWAKIPIGSIVVIDEAWKFFPIRPAGAGVPPYVAYMAEHRHDGVDAFFITQHRHQIDTFVRKMVGRHIHLERKFGAEASKIWQWEKETDSNSNAAKEHAIKTDWTYPKEIYYWYKSAEVHTVKKDFPWRKFWWLIPVGIGILIAVPFAVYRLTHLGAPMKDALSKSSAAAGNAPGGSVAGLAEWWSPHAAKAREDFLPGSARRYDGVYKIATPPIVQGCMQLEIGGELRCTCTNQGGQVLPLTVAECHALVKYGWFDPSQKYSDPKPANIEFLNSEKASPESDAATSAPAPANGGAGSPASMSSRSSGYREYDQNESQPSSDISSSGPLATPSSRSPVPSVQSSMRP